MPDMTVVRILASVFSYRAIEVRTDPTLAVCCCGFPSARSTSPRRALSDADHACEKDSTRAQAYAFTRVRADQQAHTPLDQLQGYGFDWHADGWWQAAN